MCAILPWLTEWLQSILPRVFKIVFDAVKTLHSSYFYSIMTASYPCKTYAEESQLLVHVRLRLYCCGSIRLPPPPFSVRMSCANILFWQCSCSVFCEPACGHTQALPLNTALIVVQEGSTLKLHQNIVLIHIVAETLMSSTLSFLLDLSVL